MKEYELFYFYVIEYAVSLNFNQISTLTTGKPIDFVPVILYKCPASLAFSPFFDPVVTKSISKFGPPKAQFAI